MNVIIKNDNVEITGEEIKSVDVVQEIGLISENMAACSYTVIIDNKTDKIYSLSVGDCLYVYTNGNLIGAAIIEDITRSAENLYTITCTDYIGALDGIKYVGRILENANAMDILEDMLTQTGIPYEICDDFEVGTLSGAIPICSVREALQKICFAIGAVATTEGTDKIKIFKLKNDVTQTISKDNIRQGITFSETSAVSSVQIEYYYYNYGEPDTLVYTTTATDVGKVITLELDQPYFDFTYNSAIATVATDLLFPKDTRGTYYVIINVTAAHLQLTAQKYYINKYIGEEENKNATSGVVKAITDQTLMSPTNIDIILPLCMNYYSKNHTADFKVNINITNDIVKYGQAKYGQCKYGNADENIDIKLGDLITFETEYSGELTGRVKSQRFNLNGNMIVKELEVIY